MEKVALGSLSSVAGTHWLSAYAVSMSDPFLETALTPYLPEVKMGKRGSLLVGGSQWAQTGAHPPDSFPVSMLIWFPPQLGEATEWTGSAHQA